MSFGGFTTRILLLLTLAAFCLQGRAQSISATLSGFVYDQMGAVIPGAKVTIVNASSGDTRATVSNGSGYFTFTAVTPATYNLTVQHKDFETFEEDGVVLHPTESRNLTNIKMMVGGVAMTVSVTATSNSIPDNGARSTVITANDIKHLPVEGRDVTELIKTLPGFAQIGQMSSANNVAPDPGIVGGQTNSYTANGSSPEGISIVSDGVNITDPGNGGSSDQVVNMDTVQEVTVQTSNFGADSANGPIVINAVSKSGGSEYHGELYVHGRTYQMNTQDWFSKYDKDAKPNDRYIYPGGNIGGPILIPGTNFNHNKKLTFFASGEDYIQKNVYAYGSAANATINALVPTANMRKGIFTQQELSSYFGVDDDATTCASGGALTLYQNICNVPSGNTPGDAPVASGSGYTQPADGPAISNGTISTTELDPGALAIMNNLVPLPNLATPVLENPGGSSTGDSIFNYQKVNLQDDSSYQAFVHLGYAVSDNYKLDATYSFQHSNSRNPQQLFYSPQQAFGEIDTPSGILAEDFSHTGSLKFTSVLSSSLTNQIYAGASLNYSHNWPGTKGSNLASTINFPYPGIYSTNLQYPQLDDYGYNGLPLALYPDYSSPLFQHKFVPNGGDDLTKVIGTHTIKVGVYLDRASNNQTDLNTASNGQIEQYYEGSVNTFGTSSTSRIYEQDVPGTTTAYANYPAPGNYLAAFMMGEIFQFNQYNFQTNSDLYYWTADMYATDSWKLGKKLTFDYGIRIGHDGPWQDGHKLGMAVWDPTLYASQVTVSSLNDFTSSVPNPGFTWHATNKSIPNSGTGSTMFFYSPRFGVAYDVFGTGKTVLRGGIGAYRSHDSWNDINQTQATSQGQIYASVGGGGLMMRDIAALSNLGVTGTGVGSSVYSAAAGSAFGLAAGDHQQPLTYTYSFTIDQQLKASTVFELAYQGSQSSHLLTQWQQGLPGDIENINSLPIGALFAPDPLTGAVIAPQSMSTAQVDDYRPYPYYAQVNVARHILYGNYNALQATLKKTAGRGTYAINYTWSKDMGIFGAYDTGTMIDSRNIRPNYGPLAMDRSHVVNATYRYSTGKWLHHSGLVGKLANNWEISGIVNLQSGPDAQRILTPNYNLGSLSNQLKSSTGRTFSVGSATFLGTTDVVLEPKLTCDPRSGLNHSKHQYINASCFTLPAFGVNGPASEPYIHGPGYFNTDARIDKDLKISDKKNLQFELSAFNVINRANYSFSSKYPTEQTLYFTGTLENPVPNPGFGYAQYRFGRRVAEISINYSF